MNNTRLLFVHALSPLHAGTGQGVGVIDLPIAREKATALPFLPSSSLKGTVRSVCSDKELARKLFGPDNADMESNESYASSVQFSDQKLLLLPIRSLAGTFAWVTSPYVLRRFLRDIKDVQVKVPELKVPTVQNSEQCLIATNTKKITIGDDPRMVYLEDLDLSAQKDGDAEAWAKWISKQIFSDESDWRDMLIERFCVVHDDVFNFMINTATEITARIRMQENSKTVKSGGLWYEEALPTETILSGVVLASPTKMADIEPEEIFSSLQKLTGKTMQFGGKATIGRGMCQVHIVQEEG